MLFPSHQGLERFHLIMDDNGWMDGLYPARRPRGTQGAGRGQDGSWECLPRSPPLRPGERGSLHAGGSASPSVAEGTVALGTGRRALPPSLTWWPRGSRGEAGGDDMETWGLMRGRKAVQARQVSEVRGIRRREQPARGAQPGVPVGVAVFLDDGPVLSSQKSERGLQERHLPSAPRGGSGAGQPTTQLCLSAVFKVRGKGLFVSSGKTYRIPETDT